MSPPVLSRQPRLIEDDLWASVERLIPPRPPPPRGRTGRPRISDRDVLEGIVVVLSSGIGWAGLPAELGYGSGWTCWRRMREWQAAGVFDDVYGVVLDRLGQEHVRRWSRARLSSVSGRMDQARRRRRRRTAPARARRR